MKTVFSLLCVWFLTACSDSRVTLSGGDSKSLSEYEGQWLLINYWAAWCKPCLTEIPELNAINLRSDVSVLAYNFDNLDIMALTAQASQFDIQYPSIIADPSALYDQEKPSGLPATMVINPQGEFVEWLYGAQSQESLLTRLN